MTDPTPEQPWSTDFDEALEDSLGVADALSASVDPTALGRSVARALWEAGRRPWRLAPLAGQAGIDGIGALTGLAARLGGFRVDPRLQPEPKDRRFSDPAWQDDPRFEAGLQGYLIASRLLAGVVETAPLDEATKRRARFGAQLLIDALAPTNFLITNPAALRQAIETRGVSVLRGTRNLLQDARTNGGWPRQVDTSGFRLGENMAATPGHVVFRNDVMELIQYEPTCEKVHRVPLVMCPPWINRYYIMDLAPGRSLISWAVDHGLTVFAISYRNADSSMRHLTVDDYLVRGPQKAIEVARSISGSPSVNLLGVCMGGTLNAALLARNEAMGDDSVRSATFLNSAIDFTDAGLFGDVFANEGSLRDLEARTHEKGYLDGADLAKSFDMMRANDLIFNYVVSGWLLGEDPPTLDLLAWNRDSTNMPVAMHAPFLRACYVHNALARGEMTVAGVRLVPAKIRSDTYIVAAVGDHLVPWSSSYRSTQLLAGATRFVLSSAGHIAGIVNPPGPKAQLWTNDDLPPDSDAWLAGATKHTMSWWEDWASWIVERSGPQRKPPAPGNRLHPVLEPAPGSYVRS